jgi:hypothetical protein
MTILTVDHGFLGLLFVDNETAKSDGQTCLILQRPTPPCETLSWLYFFCYKMLFLDIGD